jgi:hypothetical protein
MNDLDPQARAIVESARDADLPSGADRDRIKRAVLLQIAAGTAVAGSAAASTLSVGAKVGLAVLAVSVVGGGAVGLLKVKGTREPAAVHMRAPARTAVAPRPVASPQLIPAEAPLPSDEKASKVEKPRKVVVPGSRAPKAADVDEDQLNAEVALLKRAREELRVGRPARALDALVEYDRRFGRGALVEERQAIAAIAACQAEPGPAARAQAESFIRKAPASPLRERVREACITPTSLPAR